MTKDVNRWDLRLTEEVDKRLLDVKGPEREVMQKAALHWNALAKPLHSLGRLEELVIQLAGIAGTEDFPWQKKAVVELCADNGVVEEGVSQTGSEVTAIVAENFLTGHTTSCIMAKYCGADVIPFDFGMAVDTKVPAKYKIRAGTGNIAIEPAMTREQSLDAIRAGIQLVGELKENGYTLLATGEMGIGNTTTSSAVAAVLLGAPVEEMTGRGAGLPAEGLQRKIEVIRKAIAGRQPDPSDPVDVLAKVGGLDLAGMAGIFLGGALYRIPIVMDGLISCTAALAAVRVCPCVRDFMMASHVGSEPAAGRLLTALKKEAVLHAGMNLGEGTGALALFPLLDMAVRVYREMDTFTDIQVPQYEDFT